MAELGAAIGIIGSVLGSIDIICKIWDERKQDLKLPEAFEVVHSRLPIIAETLSACQKSLDDPALIVSEDTKKALETSSKLCKSRTDTLAEIYKKTVKAAGDGHLAEYKKYVKRWGKAKKVEVLMIDLRQATQDLTNLTLVKQQQPDLVEQLNGILDELQELEPSIAEDNGVTKLHFENSGDGEQYNNANTGSGAQTNYAKVENVHNHSKE